MAIDELTARRSPERVGRYQILERIGRGAMGTVYRARDEVMGREVALKVLMADLEDDPDIRTRFHREAEAAAALSHPNIITIFDVGEADGRFYIVMELLRGTTLKDLVKHGTVPLARKLDLMVQLCAGLGAAHNASIYHRDIKPGNVFVRADGILKILDFGVARLASSSMTASGFIVGTPDYMSPEQARGAEIDRRSDIFSLGGVFYFMVTGRKPFPGEDLPVLFNQIQNGEVQPLADTEAPPPMAAVIAKALSKRREARYQTCQELMTDLTSLRQLYPLQTGRRTTDGPTTTRVTPDAQQVSTTSVPDSPTGPGVSTTDDTVDALPIPSSNTDDTVAIEAPLTWMQRAAGRIDAAISSAFARLGRPSPLAANSQTGLRKR